MAEAIAILSKSGQCILTQHKHQIPFSIVLEIIRKTFPDNSNPELNHNAQSKHSVQTEPQDRLKIQKQLDQFRIHTVQHTNIILLAFSNITSNPFLGEMALKKVEHLLVLYAFKHGEIRADLINKRYIDFHLAIQDVLYGGNPFVRMGREETDVIETYGYTTAPQYILSLSQGNPTVNTKEKAFNEVALFGKLKGLQFQIPEIQPVEYKPIRHPFAFQLSDSDASVIQEKLSHSQPRPEEPKSPINISASLPNLDQPIAARTQSQQPSNILKYCRLAIMVFSNKIQGKGICSLSKQQNPQHAHSWTSSS